MILHGTLYQNPHKADTKSSTYLYVELEDVTLAGIKEVSQFCKMTTIEHKNWTPVEEALAPFIQRQIGHAICLESIPDESRHFVIQLKIVKDKLEEAIATLKNVAGKSNIQLLDCVLR